MNGPNLIFSGTVDYLLLPYGVEPDAAPPPMPGTAADPNLLPGANGLARDRPRGGLIRPSRDESADLLLPGAGTAPRAPPSDEDVRGIAGILPDIEDPL